MPPLPEVAELDPDLARVVAQHADLRRRAERYRRIGRLIASAIFWPLALALLPVATALGFATGICCRFYRLARG